MRVLRKIMAITLAMTLVLSMGAMTAMAVETPETMTQEALEQAIAKGGEVTLTGDVTLSSPLVITKNVTIDGGGFTIDASKMTTALTSEEAAGGGGTGKFHAIVVMGTDATLKNLTVIGATGQTQSGYGIHMGALEAGKTLNLENVTVKDVGKGGGLLANEVGTIVDIKRSTFENNAWGGIEVVPGCKLTVDEETTFTNDVGIPAAWVEGKAIADLVKDTVVIPNSIAKDINKGDVKTPFVYYYILPSISLTGIGEVGKDNTITTSELLPANASGVVTVDAEHQLPEGQVSTLTLTPNGYPDNILFKISVVDAENVDAKENLQFIAFDKTMNMYLNALITNWGPPNDGFLPIVGSTDFNIVANKAGTYSAKIEMVAMPGEAPVLVTEKFTLVVKPATDPTAGAKAELAKIDISEVELPFGTEDNQTNAEAEIAKLAQAKVAPGYSVTVDGKYNKPAWTGKFTVTHETTPANTATSENDMTVAVSIANDPTPPTVNKEELIKAVSTAETAMAAVQSSNDGADVPTDKTWATPADIETFKKAINSANVVVEDKEATQDNVVTAVIVLEKAHDAFSTTVKPGTKEEDKPVDPDKSGNADIRDMHYSVDGGENQRVENFETTTLNYKVVLPLGFSSVELIPTLPEKDVAGDITVQTEATKENNTAIVTVVSQDGKHTNTYKVTFTVKGTINPPPSGGGGGGSTPPPSQNTANDPETAEKVNDTIAALKDPTKELPKEAVKTTIAGGAGITVIPLKLTSGSASLGTDIFNTIGSAPATVGLKLTVSSGVAGGSAEIIIPGGFGKITEPGRFNFPMDYETKAASNDTMLKAVKGDNAVSMTAKVGGNFTLPVTATVTVPTKLVNGSNVNIYKYDPVTDKLIVVGKAVVKDGKITFATKMMGELLFTTGTV